MKVETKNTVQVFFYVTLVLVLLCFFIVGIPIRFNQGQIPTRDEVLMALRERDRILLQHEEILQKIIKIPTPTPRPEGTRSLP